MIKTVIPKTKLMHLTERYSTKLVILAKAGIHTIFINIIKLDSRLRGNDKVAE